MVQLGDVCEFVRGVTFDKGEVTTKPGLGKVPILRAGNIGEELDVRNDLVWVPENVISSEQLLRRNDIAICMSSGSPAVVGKTARAASNLHASVGSFCGIIRPKSADQAAYLSFFFRSTTFFKHRDAIARGANIQNLRFSQFEEIPIEMPGEQERIARELEQADRLRRTRRFALEFSDTFLPAVFLEFFGHPGSLSWQEVELHEVVDILTGYPFLSEQYVPAGDTVKLCRGANVLPGHIDWSDLALWPKSKSGHLSEFILQAGDVLIAMDRPWISEGFKVAQIRSEDCPALLVQRVARLRGKGGVPNEFLYHLLRHPAFTRHCRPTETTVPHISPKDIQTFTFQRPPLELQQHFAALASQHERLLARQREALRQADHLFQSLLDGAFR